MAEGTKVKRKAPVKLTWLYLGEEYDGWVVKIRANASWGTFENLFGADNLSIVTEALEEIIVGPWNFVDEDGNAIGKEVNTPDIVSKTPDGTPVEGPWSKPIKAKYNNSNGIKVLEERGSVHKLPRDIITEIIQSFQRQELTLPN